MMLLLVPAFVLVLLFGGVLLFGAPYVPTLRRQAEVALELLKLQPGETMLELGCGDGKVLVLAAQQGIKVIGYELNPLLVLVAKLRTWKYRHNAQVKWGSFWTSDWPTEIDGIFVFLHPRFMKRLDTKIAAAYPGGIKVASFAFPFPGRLHAAKREGIYLYRYPN